MSEYRLLLESLKRITIEIQKKKLNKIKEYHKNKNTHKQFYPKRN